MGQQQSSQKPHRLTGRLQDTVVAPVENAMHKLSRRPATGNTYPYPRTHTTVMVLPSTRPVMPNSTELDNRGERPRPPLNRAIPPIPESKSNESIQTHMSQTSEHVVVAETSNSTPRTGTELPGAFIIENRLAQSLATKIPVITNNVIINSNNNNNNNRFTTTNVTRNQTANSDRNNNRNGGKLPTSDSSGNSNLPLEPPRSPLIYMANSVRSRLSKIGSRLHRSELRSSIKSSSSLTSIRRSSIGGPDKNANFDPRLFKSASMEEKSSMPNSESTSPIAPIAARPDSITTPATPLIITIEKKHTVIPTKKSNPNKITASFLLKKATKNNITKRITGDTKAVAGDVKVSKVWKKPTMIPQPRRLEFSASKAAPLAESESSIVENSPAVEIPPSGFGPHHAITVLGASPGQRRRSQLTRTVPPPPQQSTTRLSECSFSSTSVIETHRELSGPGEISIESIAITQQESLIDPFNDGSPSKLTSPAASSGETQRGLIDDEIRDQPMLIGLGYPSDEGEPLRKRWRQSLTEETGEVSIVDLDSSGADDDSPAHHMMIHSKEVDAVEEAFQKMTVSLSRVARTRPRRSAGDGIDSDELRRDSNPFRDIIGSSFAFSDLQAYASACQDAESIKHLLLQLQALLVAAETENEVSNQDGSMKGRHSANVDELIRENDALRRQLYEKDRVIASLRRDLATMLPPPT